MSRAPRGRFPGRVCAKTNSASCSPRAFRRGGRQNTPSEVAQARTAVRPGKTALKCPFGFDLFEGFAELIQAKRAGEADGELFIVGHQHRKMALLSERMH